MPKNKKKDYISVSVRLSTELHAKVDETRNMLELTTNTFMTNAVEDWIEMAENKTDLPTRIKIARYAIEVRKRKKDKT